MTTCTVCELHAESTFRVEGMDCHEEVAILERRLSRLSGLESLDADVLGQRLRIKYDAAKTLHRCNRRSRGADRHARLARARGAGGTARRTGASTSSSAQACLLVAGTGCCMCSAARVPAWPPAPASVVLAAVVTVRRALVSARARHLDIHVLMIVAVIGAVILGEWTEAASVVFLFAIAQLLEAGAMERARGAIRALMELAPADALVRTRWTQVRVAIDDVCGRGRRCWSVRAKRSRSTGRCVTAPVTSTRRRSPVNHCRLRREPVTTVFGGTINGRGALDVEVTRLRSDSTLARIIHLVERAQAQRAPSQAFVDRFARIYTPIVLALAVLVAIVPPLVFGGAWGEWCYRSLVLLVISCPCALVISTPVSIVSGLAAAARKGVLIKGGAHLEKLALRDLHRLRQDRNPDDQGRSPRAVRWLRAERRRRRTALLRSGSGARSADPSIRSAARSWSTPGNGSGCTRRLRFQPISRAAVPRRVVGGSLVVAGSHRLFIGAWAARSVRSRPLQTQLPRQGRPLSFVASDGGADWRHWCLRRTAPWRRMKHSRCCANRASAHIAMLTGDQPPRPVNR